MTYFIFAGDMLVTLFMILLVLWVSLYSSADTNEKAALIPLEDEVPEGSITSLEAGEQNNA